MTHVWTWLKHEKWCALPLMVTFTGVKWSCGMSTRVTETLCSLHDGEQVSAILGSWLGRKQRLQCGYKAGGKSLDHLYCRDVLGSRWIPHTGGILGWGSDKCFVGGFLDVSRTSVDVKCCRKAQILLAFLVTLAMWAFQVSLLSMVTPRYLALPTSLRTVLWML